MNVLIYGRKEGCKYCTTAKSICEDKAFDMEFIDITDAGIDGAKLQEICGQPVRTVPQIFVNGEYVGGCDSFIEYLKENGL